MVRIGSLFSTKPNPIGIDFGPGELRMAQVVVEKGSAELVAAASAPIPEAVQRDPQQAAQFYQQTIGELLGTGGFRGRQAVLAAPGTSTAFLHLQLPQGDEETLRKSLVWETADRLPFSSSQAVLRHLVAGQVHRDGEQRNEVIVMAVRRKQVNQLLAAGAGARLDVVGIDVEPVAMIDCYAKMLQSLANQTVGFIDIGLWDARLYIATGTQLRFARSMGMASSSACGAKPGEVSDAVASRLAHELEMCRHYHETNFPGEPLKRLVFVSKGEIDRGLCQRLAESLGLPASLGNPLGQLEGIAEQAAQFSQSGPQPGWTVAVGLSLGAAHAEMVASQEAA